MGTTETQRKWKYAQEHYKRIPVDLQKSEYDQWKEYADAHNEPLSTMIKRMVRSYINPDSENK